MIFYLVYKRLGQGRQKYSIVNYTIYILYTDQIFNLNCTVIHYFDKKSSNYSVSKIKSHFINFTMKNNEKIMSGINKTPCLNKNYYKHSLIIYLPNVCFIS